jgi:biotin synthase
LREDNPNRLEALWRLADDARRANVGDDVHLRGLIEFSNNCVRRCGYCGISAENRSVRRYRMRPDEIVQCARMAHGFGYGSVVLQSGEDYGVTRDWMTEVIRLIKAELPLAVTLSVGERHPEELRAWRAAGADRYLIRFETSNPALYSAIHPDLPGRVSDRFAILRTLKELGYEAGSGVMVGIPGQTYEDLASDIQAFQDLDLDMIGIGPYLPHPATPLGQSAQWLPEGEQAPNTELMTYKMVALTRLACPMANIPSTTALATINTKDGRELGLQRGANVVMPNVTPPFYRKQYEIYPGKACITEDAAQCAGCITGRIQSIGRRVGAGRGASPNYRKELV